MDVKLDSPETDSIPMKKCNGCRVNLPYDQFDETKQLRFSDGFRDTCKGCRRTENAEAYRKRRDGLTWANRVEARYPLRPWNVATLDLCRSSLMGEYSFLGRGVNDGLEYEVSIDLLSGSWLLGITRTSDGTSVQQLKSFPTLGWTGFRNVVGELLYELEIRLESGKLEI